MTIKRWVASKDNTITNSFKDNLVTRATGSNLGESDVVEIFSIYAQASDTSLEKSRAILQFPIDSIVTARNEKDIPQSGSVNFILKLSNATHPFTLPEKYTLLVNALSRSWDEGYGLNYRDSGISNWISASSTEAWTTEGGDFYSSPQFSQYFDQGNEDLEIDITSLVEEWIVGDKENNGIIIRLSSSQEDGDRSYYTKKFFARGSEFFFKRPWIEARFDNGIRDNRKNFYSLNPLVPAGQSSNKLYLVNKYKGQLYDIPTVGSGEIYLRLYDNITNPLGTPITLSGSETVVTGGWSSTGIYTASVAVETSLQQVYDVWFDSSDNPLVYGSAITVKNAATESVFSYDNYVVNIKNLKQTYKTTENAKFNLFIRPSNWNPNSYTSLTNNIENTVIENIFYKIYRVTDRLDVIPYGTGSTNHTRLSYDSEGNFFEMDMSLLEPGYSYSIKFAVKDEDNFYENRETFKFRVEE